MQKLLEDEKKQDESISNLQQTVKQQEQERIDNLIKKGPVVFLKPAITDAINKISQEENKGGLPNKIKKYLPMIY